jgi:tripeptide aminopeptidase
MKASKLLLDTMRIQSKSYKSEHMEKFIVDQINAMDLGHSRDKYGNIYVTKGNADLYPTMVSHIDTVHDINYNAELVQLNDMLMAVDNKTAERYGIGGDDKVGVYITLSMLDAFDNFKAVFFKDEEVGCIGSSKADFSFFDDSTIVLECDRKGIDDFVTSIGGTKLSDETFITDIQDILDVYKRTTCSGGITDVGEIAEKNTVQVANMSCGYYDPHSDNEYIKVSEVESTKDMCFNILHRTKDKRYTIELEDRVSFDYMYGGYRGYNYGTYGAYNHMETIPSETTIKSSQSFYHSDNLKITNSCPCCDAHDVWYDDYEEQYFCMGCHSYVNFEDEDVYIDDEEMQNITDSDLNVIDNMLYDASFQLDHMVEFKKDVEPKFIKNVQ